jgi:succinoglycan biosynthesis transport protein ExoP
VLGVTSALPGEGKTTISTALAEVMATDFGLRVILLDSHAERPWPPMGDDQIILLGLSDWLSDKCSLADALIHVQDKCAMLPFGAELMSSRDLLQHLVKADALPQLRECYSLILLDLPDLINPAAAALANLCDGIMFVIHAGETSTDKFKEVIPLLQNVTIHGAVLNRYKSRIPTTLRRVFA